MRKTLWILLPLALLFGCSDDESEVPAMVTFEESRSEVEEDGNYKVINVVSSQAMEAAVEVSFETTGIAARNGHYALVTPSPIVIEAGSTSGEIVFEAIDNSVVEVNDATFTLELSAVNGAQLGEATSLTHEVKIIDNNAVPANDLQLDLLWELGAEQDIDQADLDLLLVSDIVEEEGTIVDFEMVDVSDSESGFETVLLQENHPDKEYYMVVLYAAGDLPASYRIHASNSAWGTDLIIEGEFSAGEAGGGRIYGPIPKEGSSYFGASQAGSGLRQVRTSVSPLLLQQKEGSFFKHN